MNDNNKLKGLRGWLVLVGLILVVRPFVLAYQAGAMYYPIFTDGTFEVLNAYHQLLVPLLVLEVVFNLLLVLSSFYLIFLFFSKSYLFPKVYMAIAMATVTYILLVEWFGMSVIMDNSMFDPDIMQGIGRSVSGIFGLVIYIQLSKRVKATFVEGQPSISLKEDGEKATVF